MARPVAQAVASLAEFIENGTMEPVMSKLLGIHELVRLSELNRLSRSARISSIEGCPCLCTSGLYIEPRYDEVHILRHVSLQRVCWLKVAGFMEDTTKILNQIAGAVDAGALSPNHFSFCEIDESGSDSGSSRIGAISWWSESLRLCLGSLLHRKLERLHLEFRQCLMDKELLNLATNFRDASALLEVVMLAPRVHTVEGVLESAGWLCRKVGQSKGFAAQRYAASVHELGLGQASTFAPLSQFGSWHANNSISMRITSTAWRDSLVKDGGLSMLVSALELLGAESSEDLEFVQECDLGHMLSIIQLRRFNIWRSEFLTSRKNLLLGASLYKAPPCEPLVITGRKLWLKNGTACMSHLNDAARQLFSIFSSAVLSKTSPASEDEVWKASIGFFPSEDVAHQHVVRKMWILTDINPDCNFEVQLSIQQDEHGKWAVFLIPLFVEKAIQPDGAIWWKGTQRARPYKATVAEMAKLKARLETEFSRLPQEMQAIYLQRAGSMS